MVERWEGERKDKIGAWVIGIILIGLLGGGTYVLRRSAHETTKSELDELISRDLPPGSPKAKVLAYVNSRKWELHVEENPLVAVFREERFLRDRIFTMRFTFDAEEKLVSYSATERIEGP